MSTIIIIVAIAGLVWFKFGKSIIQFIKVMKHKSFSCNPKKSHDLSIEQQKAISVGLIIAEQNMFYCDTLETGADKKEQAGRLSSAWGIFSTESALERLSLFGSSHKLYDNATETYLNTEKAEWQNYIDNHFSQDINEEIFDYVSQLDTITTLLISQKVASDEQEVKEIFKKGSIAWDLGRIVYMARASYTIGYINAEQAWQFINSAQSKVKEHFSDWKSFGQSYMLGRSLWSHDDGGIGGLFCIYYEAVNSSESPWLKYPLNS